MGTAGQGSAALDYPATLRSPPGDTAAAQRSDLTRWLFPRRAPSRYDSAWLDGGRWVPDYLVMSDGGGWDVAKSGDLRLRPSNRSQCANRITPRWGY